MEEREGISVSQAELKTRLVTVREEENAFQQDPIKRFLQIFTKKEITPLDVPLIHHVSGSMQVLQAPGPEWSPYKDPAVLPFLELMTFESVGYHRQRFNRFFIFEA